MVLCNKGCSVDFGTARFCQAPSMPFFVVQCVKRRSAQLVAAPWGRLLLEGIQQQRLRSERQVCSFDAMLCGPPKETRFTGVTDATLKYASTGWSDHAAAWPATTGDDATCERAWMDFHCFLLPACDRSTPRSASRSRKAM